jgi:hypothetical protein
MAENSPIPKRMTWDEFLAYVERTLMKQDDGPVSQQFEQINEIE